MILVYRTHFDAAHYLPDYPGACSRLHGHRWTVEVEMEGNINPATGMVMDFKELKDIVNANLPDHQFLNDYIPAVKIPTAENLCGWLWERLSFVLELRSLTIWESENAGARIAKG